MRAIVHETPGLIDLRAFTTFGVNSKPNTENPIGYFGTGLKYAVAILVRQGIPVTVWIDEEPHVFYGSETRFRDKDFLQVRMRRQRGVTARWMSTELPFTTELGRNWELWMALRELHSNTLDEGGLTFSLDAGQDGYGARYRRRHDQSDLEATDADGWHASGVEGKTRIVVQGDAYAEAFARIGEIFLPDADQQVTHGVQRLPGPAQRAYFRGMRVHDLPREAQWAWNVTWPVDLTEDRTLKNPKMHEYWVAHYVMGSSDSEMIREVLQAPEESWEGGLPWDDYEYHTVTPEFVEMARRHGCPRVKYVVTRDDRQRASAAAPRTDWREIVLAALDSQKEDDIARLCQEHRAPLALLLRADLERTPARVPETSQEDDSIPF